MWPNPHFPADLVTLAEETLNGKFHFFCSGFFSIYALWALCPLPRTPPVFPTLFRVNWDNFGSQTQTLRSKSFFVFRISKKVNLGTTGVIFNSLNPPHLNRMDQKSSSKYFSKIREKISLAKSQLDQNYIWKAYNIMLGR